MTNQEKKQYLLRYRAADAEITDLLLEKERMMSLLTKATSTISDMPGGGGEGDKIGGGIARLMELDEEINKKIDALVDFRKVVESKINTVGDSTLRRILFLRYINGLTWENVAVVMNYGYRQVCRLHGKALSELKMS